MVFGREPVLWLAVIRAAIAAGAAFGFNLTGEQVAAVVLLSEAVLALVTRSQVTPNRTVSDKLSAAYAQGAAARHGSSMAAPLVVLAVLSLGLSGCALAPKPNPTPEDEQARLTTLSEAVGRVVTVTKIARGAQDLTVAFGDRIPAQTALTIAQGFKVYFTAVDAALAVAEDTAKPLATRQEALLSAIAEGRKLLAVLDLFPGLSSMRDAMGEELTRASSPTVMIGAPSSE